LKKKLAKLWKIIFYCLKFNFENIIARRNQIAEKIFNKLYINFSYLTRNVCFIYKDDTNKIKY